MTSWNPKDGKVLPEAMRKILCVWGDAPYSRVIKLQLPGPEGKGQTCICSAVESRRRIPPSHGNHWTGRYPMANRGGSIPYESGNELNFFRLIDSYDEVEEVWSQAPTIACFCDCGERHIYTVDAGVRCRSEAEVPVELKALGFEEITLVEIKPENEVTPRVLLKLQLLAKYTGLKTVLITDVQLQQLIKGRVHRAH